MRDLFQAFEPLSHKRNILIALDRDGTLVPYNEHPEDAVMDDELRVVLNKLASRPGYIVAIISARSLALLKGDQVSPKIILAGNYGLEIGFDHRTPVIQKLAQDAVPFLKELRNKLASSVSPARGAILEDHGYSLCLHYHLVPESEREDMTELVFNLSMEYPQLRLRMLPTSFEFLPKENWNKANGLAEIAKQLELKKEKTTFFFAGDTESDESGYQWVNEQAGLSVNIGDKFHSLNARFWLPTPLDLKRFLADVAALP